MEHDYISRILHRDVSDAAFGAVDVSYDFAETVDTACFTEGAYIGGEIDIGQGAVFCDHSPLCQGFFRIDKAIVDDDIACIVGRNGSAVPFLGGTCGKFLECGNLVVRTDGNDGVLDVIGCKNLAILACGETRAGR